MADTLQRGIRSQVCVVEGRGRYTLLRSLFAPRDHAPQARPLRFAAPRHGCDLAEGDLVLVSLERGLKPRVGPRLGRSDHLPDLLAALMVERGLRRPFGAALGRAVRAQARALSRDGGRSDLRYVPTFTVDPADAKDHDDAISAEPTPQGIRLYVHIADVTAYVPPGSLLDKEARLRGNSIYLPGTVEPMLPEELSTNLCSLRPGQDRPAVTAELLVKEGKVVAASFARSLIRSDARLTYEQVDRILAGRERAESPWGGALAAAFEAAQGLARWRQKKGALVLESFEPEVVVKGRGHPRALLTQSGGGELDARGMIEQLMVAANEAVAGRLTKAGVPTIYRVHPRPDPRRVTLLRDQLSTLDLPTPPLPDKLAPAQAAPAICAIARQAYRHLEALSRKGTVGTLRLAVSSLVLRSLAQAYYSAENIGHAALASPAYCHFTSPIRRYPDIVAHRALLASLGEGDAPSRQGLRELAQWTTEREREAVEVEREGDDIARAFALQAALRNRPEAPLKGGVVGLAAGAAFLAFGLAGEPLPPYEGMLPVRYLRKPLPSPRGRQRPTRRRYELNPEGTAVVDQKGRALLRLGDSLAVVVGRIEVERGRVLLLPARPSGEAAR